MFSPAVNQHTGQSHIGLNYMNQGSSGKQIIVWSAWDPWKLAFEP